MHTHIHTDTYVDSKCCCKAWLNEVYKYLCVLWSHRAEFETAARAKHNFKAYDKKKKKLALLQVGENISDKKILIKNYKKKEEKKKHKVNAAT